MERFTTFLTDAWLHIGENDKVTVYTGKVEVGQNIRTSLSQGVAEELRLPVEKIELVMGDTQLTPFDMGTFAPRPAGPPPIRQARPSPLWVALPRHREYRIVFGGMRKWLNRPRGPPIGAMKPHAYLSRRHN